MTTFISLIVALSALLLIFSDKIIEHYLPEGGLAQISEEVDDMIIRMEDLEEQHAPK